MPTPVTTDDIRSYYQAVADALSAAYEASLVDGVDDSARFAIVSQQVALAQAVADAADGDLPAAIGAYEAAQGMGLSELAAHSLTR